MKTNKILLATILAMFVLAVLPLMSAATTMDMPVAGGNYSTPLNISVSVDTNGADNMTNVTCYYNATGGKATTWLVEMLNDSHSDLIFEDATIAIDGLTELATYNISCAVYNLTTLNTTVSKATITIDSTDPLCSLVRQSKTIDWKGTQLITWTSSDALSLVSTAVTIDRPEDGADMTYTDANRALTLLSQDTKYVGDWTVTMTGTDRPGNTCTETVTFKSNYGDGETWEPTAPKKDVGKTVLLLLIVGIVAYFIFKKK